MSCRRLSTKQSSLQKKSWHLAQLTKHAKKQPSFCVSLCYLVVRAHTCVMMPHIQNSALCEKKFLASCTKKLPGFLASADVSTCETRSLLLLTHCQSPFLHPQESPSPLVVNPTLRGVGGWERNSPTNFVLLFFLGKQTHKNEHPFFLRAGFSRTPFSSLYVCPLC